MKTEEIALSRVVENEENPRTITTEKFQKLVKSLLVFPRMLTLRPIVVDETMTVLGGNMRLRALKHIVSMDWDTLRFTISDGEKFTQGEVDALLKYWEGWRKKPVATIVNATDLTEAQKRSLSSRITWALETGIPICSIMVGIQICSKIGASKVGSFKVGAALVMLQVEALANKSLMKRKVAWAILLTSCQLNCRGKT